MLAAVKRTVVVLAAVIVGLFLLGTVDLFDFLPNPFSRREVDRSQPALLEKLSDIAEFRAASAELQVLIDVEDDVRFVPSIVAGERVTFLAGGTVDAAVDFGALDARNIDVDGDSVRVTLPPAEVVDIDVEPERSYVVNRERGILDRLGGVFADNPTGEQDLYLLAEEKLRDAADASALLARAERNTEKMLVTLLRSLGFEHVQVTFEARATR